jgi:hypothetical protein
MTLFAGSNEAVYDMNRALLACIMPGVTNVTIVLDADSMVFPMTWPGAERPTSLVRDHAVAPSFSVSFPSLQHLYVEFRSVELLDEVRKEIMLAGMTS